MTCAHCYDDIDPDKLPPDTTGDYCAECEPLPTCVFCGERTSTPLEIVQTVDDFQRREVVCGVLCARIVLDTPDHLPYAAADLAAVKQQLAQGDQARRKAADERYQRRLRGPEPLMDDEPVVCPI
jgi:hypothetical protein